MTHAHNLPLYSHGKLANGNPPRDGILVCYKCESCGDLAVGRTAERAKLLLFCRKCARAQKEGRRQ